MSTSSVQRSGGVDRTGLDNLLSTNGHPLNGLAYSTELLGGSLLGVLTMTEGRYACFFKEYDQAVDGSIERGTNRVLLVSTGSGGSRVVETGYEDLEWISFTTNSRMGYLLVREGAETKVIVFRSDVDRVFSLNTILAPNANTGSGESVVFDRGISVVGNYLVVAGEASNGLFLARQPLVSSSGTTQWEFYSGSTFQSHGQGVTPQAAWGGSLSVEGVVTLVELRGTVYLIEWAEGEATIYDFNGGVWTQHKRESLGPSDPLGVCVLEGVPAYSESGVQYTLPVVFSKESSPIEQEWVKLSIG